MSKTGEVPGAARRLSDIAYDKILENLFDKRLSAGAFVSQQHLVELLDIPVAPLRDALRVLEAEGILKIHPRSGIEFVKPGLELTRATYQYRRIIECAAARSFAETADMALMESLRQDHCAVVSQIQSEGLTPDLVLRIDELESALHNAIVGILDNPLIDRTYSRMHNYLRLVRLERNYTAPVVLRSLREHLAILDACIARDADAAEEAMVAHFSAALQRHIGFG